MRGILLFFLVVPECLFSQSGTGVRFENGLSWQEVREKAKHDHKYIFVDCYTTWCGPCKQMDKDVYSSDSVGEIINAQFVSVKAQLDTSRNDGELTRSWYADASQLAKEYNITSYPTFLFFSPEGEIIHRAIGYQKSANFISTVKNALDTTKQYYTLLKRYKAGRIDYSTLPYLAVASKEFGEANLSLAIAADYMHNFLDKLPDDGFGKRENIGFMGAYPKMISSKDRIFEWYFHRSSEVDSTMGDVNYSEYYVNYVIYQEEAKTRLKKATETGKEPNWNEMSRSIMRKFGDKYVQTNVLHARIDYYKSRQDWAKYSKYLVKKLEVDSIQNSPRDFYGMAFLNGSAMEVFKYSHDKTELQKAVTWSEMALDRLKVSSGNYGNVLDTKANLLYKLGRKDEALNLEAKAAEINPSNKEILDNFQKMKDGKETW